MRFGNLPTSSGKGERVFIESINYRLQILGTISLFIQPKKPRRKRNQEHLIRIINEFRIRIENRSRSSISRLITPIHRLIHVLILVDQSVVKQNCQLSVSNYQSTSHTLVDQPWFLLCNPSSIRPTRSYIRHINCIDLWLTFNRI